MLPALRIRSSNAVLKVREITNELVRDRLAATLNKHIGPQVTYSSKEAASIAGLDWRTLDSYRAGERAPGLDTFLRLTMLPDAGPHIASAVLGLAGYEVRPATAGDACPFHMNAELAGALQELAGMLADGRIDHMEDPAWQDKAIDVGCKLIAHANARRALREQR